MSTTNEKWEIKPYGISELADKYGVSRHTMRRWLVKHKKIIGEREGRLYTALQVKLIFERIGLSGIAED